MFIDNIRLQSMLKLGVEWIWPRKFIFKLTHLYVINNHAQNIYFSVKIHGMLFCMFAIFREKTLPGRG